ncbi:Uncharacterised protein [Lysinibacillus capsici]|uniref:Uncharacterized protein n=1 Tax=Lysinibacillus capsici TaxID=2115968 RepID=A0A2X1AQC3_9BACI|nr:hypothetical protein [Lysinibacillus capsici]SPU40634.1 Uncharacterised protein [Lysinibacillus capsici]
MINVAVIGLLLGLIWNFNTIKRIITHPSFSKKTWKVSRLVFLISSLILAILVFYLVINGKINMLNVSITGFTLGIVLVAMGGFKVSSSITRRSEGLLILLIGSLLFTSSAIYFTQDTSKLFVVFYIPTVVIILLSLFISIGEFCLSLLVDHTKKDLPKLNLKG